MTPRWNVLGYLERVAEGLDSSENEMIVALMEIIRSVSDYRNEDNGQTENVVTDWSIVKILSKVPTSSLVPEDFDRVARFLTTRYRTSLVGPEIGISLLPHVLGSHDPALVAKLFSVAIAHRWENRAGSDEAVPLIDEYWLQEMLKKHFASEPVS